MLEEPTCDSVASLVISNSLPFKRSHDGLLLDTSHDTLSGFFELLESNRGLIFSSSNDSTFITDVGDICS